MTTTEKTIALNITSRMYAANIWSFNDQAGERDHSFGEPLTERLADGNTLVTSFSHGIRAGQGALVGTPIDLVDHPVHGKGKSLRKAIDEARAAFVNEVRAIGKLLIGHVPTTEEGAKDTPVYETGLIVAERLEKLYAVTPVTLIVTAGNRRGRAVQLLDVLGDCTDNVYIDVSTVSWGTETDRMLLRLSENNTLGKSTYKPLDTLSQARKVITALGIMSRQKLMTLLGVNDGRAMQLLAATNADSAFPTLAIIDRMLAPWPVGADDKTAALYDESNAEHPLSYATLLADQGKLLRDAIGWTPNAKSKKPRVPHPTIVATAGDKYKTGDRLTADQLRLAIDVQHVDGSNVTRALSKTDTQELLKSTPEGVAFDLLTAHVNGEAGDVRSCVSAIADMGDAVDTATAETASWETACGELAALLAERDKTIAEHVATIAEHVATIAIKDDVNNALKRAQTPKRTTKATAANGKRGK
jgi:hypothetical protein